MGATARNRHAEGAQRQLPERHADLSYDGKTEIDAMMEALRHYPGFRVRVRGHTAQSGDPDLNRALSLERADAVARYMNVTYNVDPNRIKVFGMDLRSRCRAPRTSRTARTNTVAARGSVVAGGFVLSTLPMNQVKDLSPGAIRRAVLGQSLQHPSFVYPAVLGALGGIGAVVVAGSPLLLGAVALAGGAAAAALAVNYFARHDRIAGSYLAEVRRQMAAQREAQIADLAADLKEVKSTRRPTARPDRGQDRYVPGGADRAAVPQELTFARFSAIAEAVYLAAIDNLRAIYLSLKTLQAIDEKYIGERLQQLGGKKGASDDNPETKGLQDQLAQAAALHQRVKARLGQNESRWRLDRATAAIGEMRTGSDRPTLDMETAMQELARIAQRSADD